MKEELEDLQQWCFEIDEVSAGVYRATGVDKDGRSVEYTGTDPEELLRRCQRAARELMRKTET